VGERPLFIQHAEAADQQRRAPVQNVPAGYRFMVLIPGLRLVTLSNGPAFARFQKSKISRDQKAAVTAMLQCRAVRCPLQPPLTVTITRGAPGRMDSDNATISAKYVRDAIAAYLGIDDGDEERVDYVVKQEKTGHEMRVDPKTQVRAKVGIYWCRIEIARRA
jgi:hypothetical protein